ncbi:MAG: tRNA (adenosine(37)-N6)-dimethylallyltransferase MiaA [Myxococcota bacterium]
MSGRLLVVVGPTAAGKTALAMAVCERLGGEIVSADSVQVYRGLDIGSAKPTAEEQARVPHHAIDLVEPTERMDAATWCEAADAAIADVLSRGRVPVVCGGTGLYVRVLLHGLSPIPDIREDVKAAVRAEIEARGPEALHAGLAEVDPEAAAKLHPRDRQRIGRALEVWRQTGRPLSEWQAEHRFAPRRYDARVVGLWPERDVLHRRITARAERMVEAGLVEEVADLLVRGVPPGAPGLRTLGYREVVGYLHEEMSLRDLPAAIARGHRRYARRQLTWFRGITRREDDLEHVEPDTPGLVDRLCRDTR